MKNILKFLFLAIHIGSIVSCSQTQNPSLPSQIKSLQPQSQEDIKKLAKQQTVFIVKANPQEEIIGSGVIIGKQDKLVFILTARHVVGFPDQSYLVHFNDLKISNIEISPSNFSQIVKYVGNNYDFAILALPIESDITFDNKVAKLTTYIYGNMPIFLYGYLSCRGQNHQKLQSKQQFTIGKIDRKIDLLPNITYFNGLQGFDISHDANSISGLSGSPIYDSFGRVIGIHSRTDRDKSKSINGCEELPLNPDPEFGGNYATSIKVLKPLFSQIPEELKVGLQIDESQPFDSPFFKAPQISDKTKQSQKRTNQGQKCQNLFKSPDCP